MYWSFIKTMQTITKTVQNVPGKATNVNTRVSVNTVIKHQGSDEESQWFGLDLLVEWQDFAMVKWTQCVFHNLDNLAPMILLDWMGWVYWYAHLSLFHQFTTWDHTLQLSWWLEVREVRKTSGRQEVHYSVCLWQNPPLSRGFQRKTKQNKKTTQTTVPLDLLLRLYMCSQRSYFIREIRTKMSSAALYMFLWNVLLPVDQV